MDRLWKAAGAAAWGARAGRPPAIFVPQGRRPSRPCAPGARTVLVAAFPYYAGGAPGNLSLYCRGEDYHRVLHRRLAPVCQALAQRHPGHAFVPGADSSPGARAGRGRAGGGGVPGPPRSAHRAPYGSYVFLGTVLTDLALPATGPREGTLCPPNCRACQQACPPGPLGGGVRRDPPPVPLVPGEGGPAPGDGPGPGGQPHRLGCDRCQTACPHNQGAALSPPAGVPGGFDPSLTPQDLAGLSNKAFRRTYGHRAFAWRGIAPCGGTWPSRGEGLSPNSTKKAPRT